MEKNFLPEVNGDDAPGKKNERSKEDPLAFVRAEGDSMDLTDPPTYPVSGPFRIKGIEGRKRMEKLKSDMGESFLDPWQTDEEFSSVERTHFWNLNDEHELAMSSKEEKNCWNQAETFWNIAFLDLIPNPSAYGIHCCLEVGMLRSMGLLMRDGRRRFGNHSTIKFLLQYVVGTRLEICASKGGKRTEAVPVPKEIDFWKSKADIPTRLDEWKQSVNNVLEKRRALSDCEILVRKDLNCLEKVFNISLDHYQRKKLRDLNDNIYSWHDFLVRKRNWFIASRRAAENTSGPGWTHFGEHEVEDGDAEDDLHTGNQEEGNQEGARSRGKQSQVDGMSAKITNGYGEENAEQDEKWENLEYEKILRFHDQVFSGSHPRFPAGNHALLLPVPMAPRVMRLGQNDQKLSRPQPKANFAQLPTANEAASLSIPTGPRATLPVPTAPRSMRGFGPRVDGGSIDIMALMSMDLDARLDGRVSCGGDKGGNTGAL